MTVSTVFPFRSVSNIHPISHDQLDSRSSASVICLQCKDLGIVVANDLASQQHINEITTKAHKRANSILRCFGTTLYCYRHNDGQSETDGETDGQTD